jgi:hypothetical protein
LLQQAVG